MKRLITIALLLTSVMGFASNNAIMSADWNTNTTWSSGHVPTPTDSVIIPFGIAVTNSSNASCSYLRIDGTFKNSGTLTSKGFFIVNGSFIPTTGTVVFNGSSIQKISGTSTVSFYNITNKNSSDLSLSVNIDIYGTLLMSNGSVFNTNSYNLTLKSISPYETGRITTLPNTYTFNGNITQERFIKGAGWHMIGTTITTPIINATEYDETVHGNLNIGYTSGILTPGVGGFIQTISDTVISTTGPFTQGTNIYSLSLSGTDMVNDGWNLLSNPYPSEVSIDSPSFDMVGTTNVVYVWDWSTQSYLWWKKGAGGTYQSTLAQGQGFWAQSISTPSTIKIGERSKVISTDIFYRTAIANITPPSIRINLNADSNNSTIFATFGDYIDEYEATSDAQYLESQSTLKSELFTKSTDGYRIVYDSKEVKDTITIPLYIKPHTLNPHVISISGLETLPEYKCVIYNNKTGQLITDNTITFTPTTLLEKNTYTVYLIKRQITGSGLLSVTEDSLTSESKLIEVFNQNGEVMSKVDNLPNGVYIFRYKNLNGFYTKKKIIIN